MDNSDDVIIIPDPFLYLRQGDQAMLHRDYPAAEANYRAALDRYPRLRDAHFGLGRALLCLGRADEGLAANRAGVEHSFAAHHLKQPITDLKALAAEHPDLPGLIEAIILLREAQERLK